MKYIYLFFFVIIFLSFNDAKKIRIIKKLNIESDNCKEITISPNSENVKFNGRFYIKEEIIWLVLSGSSIEFYLTGKSAELNLVGDINAIFMAEDQRPRYAVYVNDKQLLDITMGELEKTIELFNNSEEKEIKIRIILLSEGSHGGIGVKNVIINSCSEKAIRPSEYKKLRIEYIGDSITCAFGVESNSASEPFQTTTQNFEKSYAYLSAQELDADYSGVCYSGSGVVAGSMKMPEYYTRTIAFSSYHEEWDFTQFPNDVVVINLGTNDHGYSSESKQDEYILEYALFLELVRENNLDAYIFCTIGVMGMEELYPLIDKAVNFLGDDKIFSFLLPQQSIDDGVGSQFHPNWVTHAKVGKIVAN